VYVAVSTTKDIWSHPSLRPPNRLMELAAVAYVPDSLAPWCTAVSNLLLALELQVCPLGARLTGIRLGTAVSVSGLAQDAIIREPPFRFFRRENIHTYTRQTISMAYRYTKGRKSSSGKLASWKKGKKTRGRVSKKAGTKTGTAKLNALVDARVQKVLHSGAQNEKRKITMELELDNDAVYIAFPLMYTASLSNSNSIVIFDSRSIQ